MSEPPAQPRRPQEPIKYGDVFSVEGELAGKPVAPQDAVIMQTAESSMLGNTLKGCAASIMQSAAAQNERAGFVGHDDVTDAISGSGVTITETHLPGHRIITEAVGQQVLGKYSKPAPPEQTTEEQSTIEKGQGGSSGGRITIGEALEASALTAGQKPVEWSDAAAVQAAEVRATGRTTIAPGGVAAAAQSAATLNARTARDEDKTKLADVLSNATEKLPSDKAVTRRDAEGVSGAEMRNDPFLTTHPAGVAASLAAAARLNGNIK